MRAPALLACLLLPLAACTDSSNTGDAAEADTDDQGCRPGGFGCACLAEDTCSHPGLECVDGLCELTEDSTGDGANPFASCGWNPANEWYDCGFRGADPNASFPRECPDEQLMPGSECPATLPFEGCCDAEGNLWYCDEVVTFTQC